MADLPFTLDQLRILRAIASEGEGLATEVVVVEPTGAETELLLQIGQGDGAQQLILVMHGRTDAQPGQTVHLAIDGAKAHVFDGQGGQRL